VTDEADYFRMAGQPDTTVKNGHVCERRQFLYVVSGLLRLREPSVSIGDIIASIYRNTEEQLPVCKENDLSMSC
jgi:hypothetical protein